MATQTVRTIYEAVVTGAQANLSRLARETDKAAGSVDKLDQALDSAGKRTVTPKIDVDIAAAEAEVRRLADELEKLEANPVDPVIRADVADSQQKIDALVDELERLERMDPSPEVTADTERAEAQLEGLMNRIEEMERLEAEAEVTVDIDRARSELDDAESKLKQLQGAKAEMVVTADTDEAFDDMGDAGAEAGAEAGEAAGNAIIEGLNSTPIVGAVSGILVGVGAYLGKQLMDDIQEAVRVEDVFGAANGLDEATARKFGTAAGLAYSNAWGDSVEANMGAATSALENALVLPDSTGREIQEVIEQLTAVSDILGSDITETAEAAGNMIRSGLAENAEEAFDIIVTGAQNGMNRSDDLLDTLREYSGMFESIGLDGAEALGLVDQAMEAGARNSDVAADALKEFSIRAQDDSKTTREAFEAMGMDADEMGEKFAQGGDTAKEGLDQVLDGLREIEDPMARNAAGVALFGTMWEDMGNGAGVLAMDLDDLGDAWVNVGDTAADAMERMQSNSATAWEKTKRTFETSIDTVLGGLSQAFSGPIEDLAGWVSTNTNAILGFIVDLGYGFFDLARAAVEFGASTVEVMGDVAGSLDGIVDGVGKTVEAFGRLTGDQDMIDLGLSIQGAADDMGTFADNADGAAEMLRTEVGGALDEAERKFEEFTGPALLQTAINDAINGMMGRVDEFVEHVGGVDATVTINGDELPAEEALNTLIAAVAESDGTVDINGNTYYAHEALDAYMREIDENPGEVTVTANTAPAESTLDGFMTEPRNLPVGADTDPAEEEVLLFQEGLVSDDPTLAPVGADTSGAEGDVGEFSDGVEAGSGAALPVGANIEPAEWEVDMLVAAVEAREGSVTVNGETVNAETALDQIMVEINESDGTVTVNGRTVPAEEALLHAIQMINDSGGTVTIEGNNKPAKDATNEAKDHADGTEGTIDVDADTSDAESETNHAARDRSSTVTAEANTGDANRELAGLTRPRYVTIYAGVSTTGSARVAGFATGGQVPGYGGAGTGYGRVPGPSAPYGVDNVLWPSYAPSQPGRASGGPILSQPLAGGEWVVNPVSSRQHDATLRAINEGASRAEIAAMAGGGRSGSLSISQQINGLNAYEVARHSRAEMQHAIRDHVPTLGR